jgi:acetylornithine deacetylase/succinyl-diaminopimelate desuccinylase-like protein
VARSTLKAVLARPVPDAFWRFSMNGGHFIAHGMATLGFAPGEERLAHTVDDSIRLADLEAAMVGYPALAVALTREE